MPWLTNRDVPAQARNPASSSSRFNVDSLALLDATPSLFCPSINPVASSCLPVPLYIQNVQPCLDCVHSRVNSRAARFSRAAMVASSARALVIPVCGCKDGYPARAGHSSQFSRRRSASSHPALWLVFSPPRAVLHAACLCCSLCPLPDSLSRRSPRLALPHRRPALARLIPHHLDSTAQNGVDQGCATQGGLTRPHLRVP